MKKIVIMMLVAALTSSGLVNAKNLESQRRSAENIGIDTSSLKEKSATAQHEIQPNPIAGLAKLIAIIFQLLFSPNGDIEIANPSTEVPQVDGALEDDQEEEVYYEGQPYDPVDPAQLPEDPFKQEPAQAAAQPQQYQQPGFQPFHQPAQQPVYQQPQQKEPRADISGQGGEVPEDLKRKARIQNKRYIGIVDFSRHSSKQRFWIVDLQSGASRGMRVAHGTGSDPDGDGFATRFSNTPNSKASSLGFYLTGVLYTGKHGKSMRLHGLSSTNSNALSRAVVLHDSNYVREANVRQGRSFGCLAVANSEIGAALSALRGGALIYAGLSGSEF